MKTNFPKDFDVEAAVQAIIDDEPDLIAERDNLIEALNQTKSIPAICKELGDIPSSTLYHYVTAKGELKKAGVDLMNISTN